MLPPSLISVSGAISAPCHERPARREQRPSSEARTSCAWGGDGDGLHVWLRSVGRIRCLTASGINACTLSDATPGRLIRLRFTAPLYSPNSSRLARCSAVQVIQLRLNRGGFCQLVLLFSPLLLFTPCISLNSASWRMAPVAGRWRRGTAPSPGVPARFLFRRFAVIHKEVVDLVFGVSERFLRQTIGSPGISGDFQSLSVLSASPARRFSACRGFRVVGRHIHLLVGDGQRVGFMPALTVRLKSLAEILFLAKTYNRGRGSQRWS